MLNATKKKKVVVKCIDALGVLLANEVFIFASDYGKKGIDNLTTKQRISNRITSAANFKEFSNYNIFTGFGNVGEADLDTKETRELADVFLPATGCEWGKESTPRAHRGFKITDLTKKNTRKFFELKKFPANDPRQKGIKSMLVELRAHNHYTMAMGQHDNGQKLVWTKADGLTEVTWGSLYKSVALLAAAAAILEKYPAPGSHDEYLRLMVNSLWYAQVDKADCEKIIKAVLSKCGCKNCAEGNKLAKVKTTYEKDRKEEIQGLPTLVENYSWSETEHKDFKKILLAITGRDSLPEYAAMIVEAICFVMKQNKYWDFEDQELYDKDPINVKFGRYFKKYTATKAFQSHPDRKICKDFKYVPTKKPGRYIKIKKSLYVNTYTRNDLEPNPKADTDLFWAVVKHLIPHDEYRNHFLDWFTFPMQQPGVKIRHAIILQSDTRQLAKGSLFDMQRDILGHHNTNKIDLQQAINRERNFLIDRQTVLIDEAKAAGTVSEKYMLINTLKGLISEYTAGTRLLYRGYKEQDTCTNIWINTNYKDALPIEYNDPRYFVYFSPAQRNEKLLKKYHQERLHGDLAAGVYAELLDRDLSKFDPVAVAPDSPFKDEMFRLADRPANDYVQTNFEQSIHPFDRDLVTASELFNWLRTVARVKGLTRENDVAAALQLIGGTRKRGCPVAGVGSNVNVWIIRNHDKYKNLTAKELGKLYVGFYTDSKAA
jgi:hypothetical protein